MNWKKTAFGVFNVALAVYLVLAMTAFNKPDDSQVCRHIRITIEEGVVEGFLSAGDIKLMLIEDGISPIGSLRARNSLSRPNATRHKTVWCVSTCASVSLWFVS